MTEEVVWKCDGSIKTSLKREESETSCKVSIFISFALHKNVNKRRNVYVVYILNTNIIYCFQVNGKLQFYLFLETIMDFYMQYLYLFFLLNYTVAYQREKI